MKDKIIKILQAEAWNVTNQAGDLCTVIEEEDFNDIAERIVKLFAIPDVSGISLEQLKLQKECYRERKERNGKSTAYGEAHTDEIREGVIDHLIALSNYR